jgi:uncharacterized repeat protein (TIGR03803 family)
MKRFQGQSRIQFPGWLCLCTLLAGTTGASAQTFTILHSFSSFTVPTNVQGAEPAASLILSNNTLYGTTEYGGNAGNGTVFSVHPDGSSFMNLHSFSAVIAPVPSTTNDGANPTAALVASGNLLYGTAAYGGSDGWGTVFAANTDGSGLTTLHSFTNGVEGASPVASLTLSGNILYGTTQSGGISNVGTIFAINTDGTGFTNVYTFTNGSDGAYPAAGLVLAGNKLFGTAGSGGTGLNGTIFAVKTNGTGFTTLHSFAGDDGAIPMGNLILSGGTLYGTTESGGTWYYGTVFAIQTDGSDYTNFYSFTGFSDGSGPEAGLVLSNNVLYGTAASGGNDGAGTVFAVNTDGLNFTTLYSFTGGSDGLTPVAALYLTNNMLYGTTEYGGASSNGTVFAVNADGLGFTNLYSFTGGDDGANPVAGLVGDNLYGTTYNGGNAGEGALFALQTDGTGFTNLHSFVPPSALPNSVNNDGANPVASLVLSGNTLYGTAESGGSWGNGTVFAVHTDGSGFTNLYTFTAGADGALPTANLILSGDTLYGTTQEGGIEGEGTVFSLHTDGSDFTVLYRFSGESDGANPSAGLFLLGDTLYGTTLAGGIFYGTIFAINTNGTGFRNVYSFTGGDDGNGPDAALILSGKTLYGTAETGGSTGWGTVFSIQTDGSNFMLLHGFTGGLGGGNPYAPLLLVGSTLYGTAFAGGISNNGTVFAVQTDGLGFTNLYRFTDGNDGAGPAAGLILSGSSTLYGTAEYGGSGGDGAVFSIQTDGMGFVNLHSFVSISAAASQINGDGAYPLAGLLDAGGTLYGTANGGGTSGFGTVFSLLTNGSNFTTLYNFTNGSDGAYPQASFIRRSNTLFSTAAGGGASGLGTVFAIQTNGAGFISLHSFAGGNDGAIPVGRLLFWSNVLYGTTSAGGLSNNGTIFAINPDGSGYATLYSFTGRSDGAAPQASLMVWSNSWLLCTASAGGTSGNGTLFAIKVTPAAQATQLGAPETMLFSFPGGSGGSSPYGTPKAAWDDGGSSSGGDCSSSCGGGSFLSGSDLGSALVNQLIYATTAGMGISGNYGTVQPFMFDPSAGGFLVNNPFPLNSLNGAGADGDLLRWNGYGWFTTESGGASGYGCISAYNYSSQTAQLAYNFRGGIFGSVPTSDLLGLGGDLYGVAAYGGIGQNGLIYDLQPCAGSQTLQAPMISAAIYNSSSSSLLVSYSGSAAASSPQAPTTQMWGTLYNPAGTSSPLGSFDISTQDGGAFSGTHVFHVTTMPPTVAFSISSLCGESALSSPFTVSLAPELNFEQVPGNQWKLSWSSSVGDWSLQTATTLSRRTVWTDWTGSAPVLLGTQYSVTFPPPTETMYFRLASPF